MRFRLVLLAVAFGISFSMIAEAYEKVTHRIFTRQALAKSVLTQEPEILSNLALDLETVEKSFNTRLHGITRIRAQLENGAEYEDDAERPARHFFDPISGDGIYGFANSPSWALEDDGPHEFPGLQLYSLADAQDVWYELLTLSDPQFRLDRAAFFFEALGRVVHHVQDMAQPQHTRGDDHFQMGGHNITLPWENHSLYERWTSRNVDRFLLVANYPIPVFPTAREFWTTPNDLGIADYSNAGFVSAGTNFPGSGGFPKPSFTDATIWSVTDVRPLFENDRIDIPTPCRDVQTPCHMVFFETKVEDFLNPALSAVNKYTSTFSMLDDALVERNKEPVYSLNRFNFNSANAFLIPRAVSYSTGLLDFVFRGRLAAKAAEREDGTLRIVLTNQSSEDNTFSQGEFELWYDDDFGNRYSVNGLRIRGAQNGMLVTSFNSDEFLELEAAIPPHMTAETRFLLTYRGMIGQSAGITSVSFQVEPYRTGFAVSLHNGPPIGYISWENNEWKFNVDTDVQAGNIDWRGDYVDGKPMKTLTWSGPTSRYFDGGKKFFTFNSTVSQWRPSTFRPYVYENGRLLAVAPGPVLGAGLMRESNGKEWLVIVTNEGPLRRVVYRRPYERSDSSTLFDPINNPSGWKEIGRYLAPPDEQWTEPRSPWFFNGDGTAAQTMETIALSEDELPPAKLVRLELRISDEKVSWIYHGNLNNEAHWVNVTGECTSDYTEEYPEVYGNANASSARSGSTVVAVDYLDDEEILAVMHAEGTTTSRDLRDTRVNQIDSSSQNLYQEWLLMGKQRFDLSEVDTFRHLVVTEGGGGSFTLDHAVRTSQIRYMDLREGILQLAENSASIDSIDEPSPPGLQTNRTSYKEVLVTAASSIIIMDEESTVTQTLFQVTGLGQFSCPSERITQLQERPFTNYWPRVEIVPTCPLCVPEINFYSSSYVGLHGSVAIDNAGRIFSSQDILKVAPSPTVTSNYLSGASGQSPAAVIGIGDDKFTLFEPRVIR